MVWALRYVNITRAARYVLFAAHAGLVLDVLPPHSQQAAARFSFVKWEKCRGR